MEAIVLPPLEYDRALSQVKKNIKVFERSEFMPKNKKGKFGIRELIHTILNKYKSKIWKIPASMPYLVSKFVLETGVEIRCTENSIFFPEREFKKPNEVKNITKAMRLAERAMKEIEDILTQSQISNDKKIIYEGKPLTSEFLRRKINLKIVSEEGTSVGTIVAGGKSSAEPHNEGNGILKAGEPIIVDIFPRLNSSGYWGDITRTFVKGKAPKTVKNAFLAVREARDCAKSMIKVGVKPSDLYKKANAILEKHGFKTGKDKDKNKHYGFFHSLGHGVGLEIHEAPGLNSSNDKPLKGGEVVTVEPGLYYPSWGGVRLEDVVHVKNNSAETLTSYPTNFEID